MVGRFALAAALLACSVTAQTPITRVIMMLEGMKRKGIADLQIEKEIFAKYKGWADKQTTLYTEQKTLAGEAINDLTAYVAKADADITAATTKIGELDGTISTHEDTLATATATRKTDKAKFTADQTDYSESIYALEQAIMTMKNQDYDRKQAMTMLQTMARNTVSMRRILALVELDQEEHNSRQPGVRMPDGAPEVAAYEFQSSAILDMLAELQAKFRKELDELQKGEMNSAHQYDMEAMNLNHLIKTLNGQRTETIEFKAKTEKDMAEANNKLAQARTDLAESTALLSETTTTYGLKKAAYDENQLVREQEIEAITQALEILQSATVAGNYSTRINAGFVQMPAQMRKVNLLQLHSQSSRSSRNLAAEFLQGRAKALNSRLLATLAAQMGSNPFEKVITMIKDLLVKLKEDAASEAEHKAFCDEEVANNKAARDKHTAKANSLQAEISLLQSKIADQADAIATLAQEQADLADAMTKAQAQRTEEKTENTKCIADAIAAQTALKQAVSILKTFYAAQGAFLQKEMKSKQPQTSDFVPEMKKYKGMQAKEGGVIGMLEVVQSDFSRLEVDTKASEAEAASEHKKFMADSTKLKKEKHDEEFQLTLQKDQNEFLENEAQKDLTNTNALLKAANDYFEQLKPMCIKADVSYEERAAGRKEEIEALKEAYKLLNSKGNSVI